MPGFARPMLGDLVVEPMHADECNQRKIIV